jgi:N-acetylmuramic acid 6-phosphate etherase
MASVNSLVSPSSAGVLLGLECGGTRTVALAADGRLNRLARIESGPANLRLVTDEQLAAHFAALAKQLPVPAAIGVGMAGVRDRADCERVERVLERVWPGVPRRVDHDLESALAAAELDSVGQAASLPAGTRGKTDHGKKPPGRLAARPTFAARVIVLSGTGSCCYGRNVRGEIAKVGGWGHHLGDRGSAYDIAHTALRLMARRLDHEAKLGAFGRKALQHLLLNEPNDLIAWFQQAGKGDVAALAPLVFAAAAERDPVAKEALAHARAELVADAVACANRLAKRGEAVEFVWAGSVVLKQPAFAKPVGAAIRKLRLGAARPLARESVWGAVAMAREALGRDGALRGPRAESAEPATKDASLPSKTALRSAAGGDGAARHPYQPRIPVSTALSPTERRNPRSMELDRLPLGEAIELMLEEETEVPAAIRQQRVELERLIQLTVRGLKSGGRLLYVGAGTSGRLGVLDASECPPTFRTPPELVQGIMAGGVKALHSAVEGAEDDFEAGARAVEFREVGRRDVILGIAASGRTPFVWGALGEAKQRRAKTAILCFNPFLQFARGQKPDVVLALNVGPEVLTGSTRLKAGTATKLVLNLLTTLTMVRLGKVVGNLMVDLNPSNVKLRDRACRIVAELTGRDYEAAKAALERHGWVVKDAIRALGRR